MKESEKIDKYIQRKLFMPFRVQILDAISDIGGHKPKVKLAILVKADQKVPFSMTITPRCKGVRYSILCISPLYSSSLPYNAECISCSSNRKWSHPLANSLTIMPMSGKTKTKPYIVQCKEGSNKNW